MKAAQFSNFVIIGVVNTGLTYGIFLILQGYVHYSLAYTVAFVVGIALSYLLNVLFVFKGGHSAGAALKFPFIYLIQYVYGSILLALLVEVFTLPKAIAMLVVTTTSALLTFVLMRRVFESSRPHNNF